MHVRTQIIWNIQCDYLSPGAFVKIVEFPLRHIMLVDVDIVISVRSTLFVPKSYSMTDLMGYGPILEIRN